jgi:hypothetical protein
MNREEVRKLLGEGATEEQVTAVLDKFHAEQGNLTKQVATLQNQVTDLTTEKTELLGYKAQIAEIEKSKLSEQEKIELQRKELAQKNKDANLLINSIKAKSILVGAGIGEAEADELVATIVKEDEQATIASATLFVNQFNSIKENTAKQTREELANVNLKPTPTNIPPNSNAMTWDKFSEMSVEEQNKFAEEHPEEFNNL